jgi:glutathione synthase/RimK-type ligase-like ATP-grasp enzyme
MDVLFIAIILMGAEVTHAYWRSGSKAKAAVNVLAGAEVSNIGRAPAFSDIAVEVAPA